MVGPSKRFYAGVVVQYFFTLGYMLTSLFAYLITDWRTLQISLSLPGLLFLLYWWYATHFCYYLRNLNVICCRFVPESARWLLTKGRDEEARIVLRKAAKENKVDLPDEMLDKFLGDMKQEEEEGKAKAAEKKAESTILDLFKHPNLRRKTLLILFLWYILYPTLFYSALYIKSFFFYCFQVCQQWLLLRTLMEYLKFGWQWLHKLFHIRCCGGSCVHIPAIFS